MTDWEVLSRWEEVYLLSIWELKDNAYGVSVKRLVSKKTGMVLSYGGLYFTLAQLAKKGLVTKQPGEPTHQRGGRRKYYYSLTNHGKNVLKATYEHQQSLWENISGPLFEKLG